MTQIDRRDVLAATLGGVLLPEYTRCSRSGARGDRGKTWETNWHMDFTRTA